MKIKLIFALLLLTAMDISCSSNKEEENIITKKDGSGNTYTEIEIGTQIWLKEDIHSSQLLDGTHIRYVSDWQDMVSLHPEYTTYEGGYFYNTHSQHLNNICPKGYAVPTESHWNKLINFYGGNDMGKEKVSELINTLGLNTGSPSGFNENSAIYCSGRSGIVYFRTNDGGIGFNPSIGANRIRCIKL